MSESRRRLGGGQSVDLRGSCQRFPYMRSAAEERRGEVIGERMDCKLFAKLTG